MMIHDVSLLKLHVVFCIDRAGLVGSDGETHHGIFDVSYLRTVPGMKILCPASFGELSAMLEEAVNAMDGPVAVRYPRGGEGEYREVHTARETLLREGSDVTLAAYGTMIDEMTRASAMLAEKGIQAEVIKLAEIDGSEFPLVYASVRKTRRLVVAEEVCAAGCVGDALAAGLAKCGIPVHAACLNLGEGLVPHGSREQLMRDFGIDAASVSAAAASLCADS